MVHLLHSPGILSLRACALADDNRLRFLAQPAVPSAAGGLKPNWVSAKVQWRFRRPPNTRCGKNAHGTVLPAGPPAFLPCGQGWQRSPLSSGCRPECGHSKWPKSMQGIMRLSTLHSASTSSSVPSWPILPMVSGQRVISAKPASSSASTARRMVSNAFSRGRFPGSACRSCRSGR